MYIDGQVAKVESMTSDGSVKLSVVVPRELVSGKDLLSLQHQNVRVTDEQETLPESPVTSNRDESLSILAGNADKLVAANMELLSMIKAELAGENDIVEAVKGDMVLNMNKPNGSCDTGECAYHEHGKCYNQDLANQCTKRSLPESTTVDTDACYNADCDFHEGDTTCTDDPPYNCPLHKPEADA